MISGIQHFLFCKRQWALIHIEQQWEENYLTVDGMLKHQRVDDYEIYERRRNVITIRSLPVKSHKLGIIGKCDLVELIKADDGIYIPKYEGRYSVFPVEYKRGKPKTDFSDKLQLLAQSLCLEEMLETSILKGFIFYFETRRREEVIFSNEMRAMLYRSIEEMHSYMEQGFTPKVRAKSRCKSCSLKNTCLPEISKNKNVNEYINKRILE